jgi:hypothetical protein
VAVAAAGIMAAGCRIAVHRLWTEETFARS